METADIAEVLAKDAYTRWMVCDVFDGVHAADQLHESKHRPTAMVINTDPSWRPGRHWVAIYVPCVGPVEYFDSYGKSPDVPAILRFLRGKPSVYNRRCLQSRTSEVCGQYCIYYLVHRARGRSMEEITGRFGTDKNRNDEDVDDFVHRNFNLFIP